MKILCIDVGNTSIHYGIVENENVQSTADFSTQEALGANDSHALQASLRPLIEQSQGIAYCSVVPSLNPILENVLCHFDCPVFRLNCDQCPGLPIVYPKPAEIGQDRLANALAAQALYGLPAIIIDMGTAVSFDVVSSQGYEGGIIAPGIGLMTRYLHEQTALLPPLEEADLIPPEIAIGKSTVEAMRLGVAIGFSGMIDALLERVITELKTREEKEPVVLATGGSSANLTADWANKIHFVENLTLKGLAVAYQRQNNR
ncbi:MAG: type III pantothenate kinase [Coraliomargaritaceae bacterium]